LEARACYCCYIRMDPPERKPWRIG